jgi:glycosyltransferase involved in cell wall biosynthesis
MIVQLKEPVIAVLIPCLNEESTIATVISDCRRMLPNAEIFVYENNSTDNTKSVAIDNGAKVKSVLKRGKGSVITRMFADISADVYVMIDGDATYGVERLNEMVQLVVNQEYDLVSGRRLMSKDGSHRMGHQLGNRFFSFAVKKLFNSETDDALTGLRVMSKRFVKTFTGAVNGFELEVALMAHASTIRATTVEVPVMYFDRPENSHSKLNTYRDGLLILSTVFRLYRQYRPARFFGSTSASLFAIALINFFLGSNRDHTITWSNMFLLAVAVLTLASGIVLNAITKMRTDVIRLAYLSYGHQTSSN